MNTLFFFLFLPSLSFAFTLNNNFEAAFDKKEVKVFIDNTSTCANAGLTPYELADLVKPAVEKFWNTVPTSSLRLKAAGFSDPVDNINSGRLCPPTDDQCISGAGSTVIPPVSGIVIACNNNPDNYGNSGSDVSNVLAVTVPNNFSGKKIKGAIILINNVSGSAFSRLSHGDKKSVIAHEIGHAIGLGHSEDKAALMYYRTVDLRSKLGQDDIDGVSYLYPVHVDGCGGFSGLFGGTISTRKDDDFPFWPMVISLLAMVGIFELLRLAKLRTSGFAGLFRA